MIRRLFLFTILVLLGAIGSGFLGALHPAFDTIANFRIHICAVLIVFSIVWIFAYGRKLGLIFIGVAIANLFLSHYIPARYRVPETAKISTDRVYSLLQLNLFYGNKTPDKVIALIGKTNPDFLTLNEISKNWKRHLAVLDKDYPYQFYCPEWSQIGGSVIYSRYEMTNDKVTGNSGYCHDYAALALKSVIIDNKILTIGAVHLRWPWPASGPRQVDNLKPRLNRLGPSVLIAGDFNSSTWTWTLRRFAHYGGLQIITGISPTWLHQKLPAWLAKFVGFPIDNAMVKGRVVIKDARSLGPVGSDHLPILIRFKIF
jgi:endonuclease/exonuclease/phosphatase (EEP) superfamily protein YafD